MTSVDKAHALISMQQLGLRYGVPARYRRARLFDRIPGFPQSIRIKHSKLPGGFEDCWDFAAVLEYEHKHGAPSL